MAWGGVAYPAAAAAAPARPAASPSRADMDQALDGLGMLATGVVWGGKGLEGKAAMRVHKKAEKVAERRGARREQVRRNSFD